LATNGLEELPGSLQRLPRSGLSDALPNSGLKPVKCAMKPYMSAYSSICLSVGLPDPWPARVSMRMRCGAPDGSAACSAAAYLKLWPGVTRSSVSAVVIRVGGMTAAYGYGGYGGQQQVDLTWRCRTDYRGFVVDIDIDRARSVYGSTYQPYNPYEAYGYRRY